MTGWRHVALVGPRGAGKSTMAASLARALRWSSIDADEVLATEVGAPAGEHLARVGEPAFRAAEERVSCSLLTRKGPAVIALGGGAVLSARVRQALAASDVFTVFLVAEPGILARRLRADPALRPSLTGLPADREVGLVLQGRLDLYREVADLEVDTGSAPLQECVSKVVEAVSPGR